MRTASLAIGAVVVLALLVGWIGGRFGGRFANRFRLASDLVFRLSMGVFFALVAGGVANHGGYAWIVFPLAVLGALWSFGFAGLIVWVWVTRRVDD